MYLPESLECDNADSNLAISTLSLWVNLIHYFTKMKMQKIYIFELKSARSAIFIDQSSPSATDLNRFVLFARVILL